MLGAGLDAQVVHRLPLPLKRLLGRGAYVLQTIGEAVRYPYRPLRVRIDGAERTAASVVVCKGRLYGGPFLLAPGASPAAPGFTVALFGAGCTLATLGYSAALPLNLLPHVPGLTLAARSGDRDLRRRKGAGAGRRRRRRRHAGADPRPGGQHRGGGGVAGSATQQRPGLCPGPAPRAERAFGATGQWPP